MFLVGCVSSKIIKKADGKESRLFLFTFWKPTPDKSAGSRWSQSFWDYLGLAKRVLDGIIHSRRILRTPPVLVQCRHLCRYKTNLLFLVFQMNDKKKNNNKKRSTETTILTIMARQFRLAGCRMMTAVKVFPPTPSAYLLLVESLIWSSVASRVMERNPGLSQRCARTSSTDAVVYFPSGPNENLTEADIKLKESQPEKDASFVFWRAFRWAEGVSRSR